MTTANDVLDGAQRWLGTTEQPAGSNNVPGITDWYGITGAWCAMFISRVFWDAGMPLPASTPKGFAWVSAGFDWMQRQGWLTFTDWRQARPGDLIAWEWGSTPGGYDHISMVWSNDTQFITIGGNERDRVKFEFFGAPGGAALFARPPFAPPVQETDMPLTSDEIAAIAELSAQRTVAYAANPSLNPGTVIDPGARSALSAIETGLLDPVSGIRAQIGKLSPAEIAEAVPAEIAQAVADELARRLGN